MMTGMTAPAAAVDDAANCPEPASAAHMATSEADAEGAQLRCGLTELLIRRGITLTDFPGHLVIPELAKPYLTIYHVHGEAPLPKRLVDDLIKRIPETARLVNEYQDTEYHAAFADPEHNRFVAANGQRLHALFTYIYREIATAASDYLFHETGQAKVLFWHMAGSTVIRLELHAAAAAATTYRITIYAFSSSAVVHLLMESAPFKYFARRTFDRVVQDIVDAVRKYREAHGRYP